MAGTAPHRFKRTATIANNESLSTAVHSSGLLLAAISMPADWTAADLTFQASADGTTFWNVYDASGVEKTVDAAEDRFILLDPAEWAGVSSIKVRSGTSGSAVNQGAERLVTLVFRAS